LDRAAVYVGRAGALSAGLLACGGLSIYAVRKLVRRSRSVRESQPVRITPVDPMRSIG